MKIDNYMDEVVRLSGIEISEDTVLQESVMGDALDLRAKIRSGEDELSLEDLDLPSEDSIMDSPRKYGAKMKKALDIQDAIRKLK